MMYLTYYRENSSGKTARCLATKVLDKKKGRHTPALLWKGGSNERYRRLN